MRALLGARQGEPCARSRAELSARTGLRALSDREPSGQTHHTLMLISEKMNAAINQQVGNEFGASLQYVAIAAHFAGDGLNALAAHFDRQAEEERDHAMRFVRYLVDAGGKVEIPDIPAPRAAFKNVADAVRLALNHELKVTSQINSLVDLALKETDHISREMLSWFVKEQLEEVSSMDNLLKVVQLAGESNLIHVEEYILHLQKKAAKKPAEAPASET